MIDLAPRTPLERDVKQLVTERYRKVGCCVSNLDQGFRPGGPKHATTRQRKGLGDLWVTYAGKGGWWHEVKTPTGVQRWEQQVFEAEQRVAGVGYVCGGPVEALRYLGALGLWRLPDGYDAAQFGTPWAGRRETEAEYAKRMERRRRGRRLVQTSGLQEG